MSKEVQEEKPLSGGFFYLEKNNGLAWVVLQHEKEKSQRKEKENKE